MRRALPACPRGDNATRVGGAESACGINHHVGGQHHTRPPVGDRRGVIRRRAERLRLLLRRQRSVVARAQLLELGFTPREIDRRLESGVFRALHRGVYLIGPIAPPLAREMAVVLACGAGAVLSHRPAAHLWSLTPYLPKAALLEVTVPGRDPGTKPGIRVHRIRALAPDEHTTLRRIPITTPARTLLDIAPTLNPRQLERSLAEGIRRNLLRPSTLTPLLARHPGRPGAPALRRLLDRDEQPAFTRSEAEERFLALIRQAELPAPEVNAELGPYEIDFLWRSERLAIETDSWAFHGDRNAFEEDRRRDADLVSRGYRVIRVTWRQVTDTPIAVIARIAAALANAA